MALIRKKQAAGMINLKSSDTSGTNNGMTGNNTGNNNNSGTTPPPKPKPGSTTSGVPSQDTPGSVTDTDANGNTTTSYVPAYLGGIFPGATFTEFDPIEAAKYNFVNPMEFSKSYSPYLRNQIKKNFQMSQEMGLKQLDTELAGLQSYAPAAAALKRNQISIDNQFNQYMRQQQVDSTMPTLRGDLTAQRARANAYAQGKLPSEQDDRALELGMRADAADRASAGGFGAKSLASQKASSLMSAENRLKVAQYGEQLLGSNIGTEASMYLSPTEYSNAGNEIKVMPEVGAGRATASYLGEIDQASVIPASTALSDVINQNQFQTNLIQRTKEYNASNQFQESINNAGIANNFALTKFQYETGYAAAVAGSANAAANTNFQIQQQALYGALYDSSKNDTQNANTIRDTAAAITAGAGLISAVAGATGSGGGQGTGTGTTGGSTGTTSGTSGTTGGAVDQNIPRDPTTGEIQFTPDTSSGGSSGSTSESPGASMIDTGSTPDFNTDYNGVDKNSQAGLLTDAELNLVDDQSTAAALNTGTAINTSAGITDQPRADSQVMGVDKNGNTVYVSKGAAANTDLTTGERFVNGIKGALDPMGGLSKEETDAMALVGSASKDAQFILQIDAAMANGDTKGAANLIMDKFGRPLANAATDTAEGRARANGIITAGQVLMNWNSMSNSSKAMALAGLGLTVNKALGGNLMNKVIPKTDIAGSKSGLTYGEALNVLASGISVYNLIDNWDQLSDAQRIIYGTNTGISMVQVAKDLGLTGSATGTASTVSVVNLGYGAAPSYGPSAFAAAEGTKVPQGYVVVGKADGMQIITQPSYADAARGSISSNSGKLPAASNPPITNNPSTGQTVIDPTTGQRVPDVSKSPTAGADTAATGTNTAAGGGSATGGGGAAGATPPETPTGVSATRVPAQQSPNYMAGTALTAGGAAQVYMGYREYQSGDKTAGGATMAQGGTMAAAGISELAGYGGTSAALSKVSGYIGMAKSIYNLYRNWGEGDPNRGQRAKNATFSATDASLSTYMASGNGYAAAAAFVINFSGSMIRAGKNEDQKYRDTVRTNFKDIGVVDDNYNIKLADGKLSYIGDDGHSGEHDARYADKIQSTSSTGKLHSYDVDYTNDLDYIIGTGGITLSRLLIGGKNTAVDQMGGQIGNAVIRDTVGYGKDMTQANFDIAAKNMRAAYANTGVKSKADAYQMSNMAYHEGRINMTELYSMQRTIDTIFDPDGYQKATKLLQGRWAGAEPMQDKAKQVQKDLGKGKADPTTTVRTGARADTKMSVPTEDAGASPAPADNTKTGTYTGPQGAFAGTGTVSASPKPAAAPTNSNWKPTTSAKGAIAPTNFTKARSTLGLSKETIRDLNRKRYSGGARL